MRVNKYNTYELSDWFNEIKHHPNMLLYIPDKFNTIEIKKLAVTIRGSALQYIPYSQQTIELVELATRNLASAVIYANPKLITFELALYIVRNCNSPLIRNLPKHLQFKVLLELLDDDYKLILKSNNSIGIIINDSEYRLSSVILLSTNQLEFIRLKYG